MTCARGTQAVSFALFTSRKKREEALRKSSGARERRQNLDTSIGWLLLLQVVLIALNAVFACAEIAVLSVNEVKLSKMVSEGSRKAKRLSRLTAQPARFLATIQVAITLAGFLGSAFAADNFAVRITRFFTVQYALPDADFAVAFDQWTVTYADGSARDFDATTGTLAD